jgi:hypothetical protein
VNRDLAFGIAGVVVAVVYVALAVAIPESALADAVGPRGLPIAYAVVLLLLSLILIGRSLRSPTPDPQSPLPGPRFHLARVGGMLALGVAYVVLVPWLGYAPTLAGLILAITWYQSGVVTRTTAVVAVAGAIVFWLVFVALLGIPQPPGIWARRF